jgi:N-acetylglucosamine-6-phosphate deacetylase
MLALTAKALFTPLEKIERPIVVIDDGVIAKMGPQSAVGAPPKCQVRDFGDAILFPGLMDVHTHGAAGFDVMQADASELGKIQVFIAQHGVTSYFPTTVTAPLELTLHALERLADAVELANNGSNKGAQPLGIHLEGPFLSHERRGMHPARDLMKPSIGAFDKFWQAARGRIRLLTVAPELDGAIELIAEATKRGVTVSIGHSDADLDRARKGVAAGARHATHTFNAMRPLDHRFPGIVGEVLTNPDIAAEIIVDGVHLHPDTVQIVTRAKGADGTVLITDATAATGMPDGKYMLGEVEIEVKDGMCTHEGTLAGSVLTLDRAVRNVMNFAQWDLPTAVRAASLNPAKTARVRNKGLLQAGADADFVVMNASGEVKAAILKGAVLD